MTTARVSLSHEIEALEYSLPVNGKLTAAYYLSFAAAIQLMVSAVGGLQYGSTGLYPWDSVLLAQFLGQDALALLLSIPALFAGMWMTRRGSARGLVVWNGTLLYIAYWYHFYLAGIPFGPLYLIHVGTVASSLLALMVLMSRIDVERFARRFSARLPVKPIGGFMVALSGLFFTAWIADIVFETYHREAIDSVARGVYSIDLTIMLPATIAAGVMLWRRQAWGYVLAGPLLINAFASTLTLLTTTTLVALSGESVGLPLAMLPFAAAIMLACVIRFIRDLRV